MPVELRKRKAAAPPAPAPAPKKASKVTKVAAKAKEAVTGKKVAPKDEEEVIADEVVPVKQTKKPETGDIVPLEGFGGEIETNDGEKTTLKELVDKSEAGVVLFTYPKASTPGCESPTVLSPWRSPLH